MWLQNVLYQGKRYLGRNLGDLVDVDHIALQESNINSFLRKIVPSYPYEAHPLVLLPMLQNE